MFEALTPRPADAIIQLMQQAAADPNPLKIDLGVGVYKASDGTTPILKTVKKAETLYLGEELTKSYVSTTGNVAFRNLMSEMVLGKDSPAITEKRLATSQAAGGSGALRLGAELIFAANPKAKVWVSTPTWGNHIPLISSCGLELASYPYYNRETLGVNFDEMIAHLDANAVAGDVLLLHGCCHNPTGADFTAEQWDAIADFVVAKGLTPFIDLAYYGLGRGLTEDIVGTRKIVAAAPEVLIAVSCSKNFALYKERVGLICAITKDADTAAIAEGQFSAIQRKLISMPPDHGAALVVRILGDAVLRGEWEAEVNFMRERLIRLRAELSDALDVQGGETIAAAIKNQSGMFSMLPVTPEQAIRLRDEFSIYIMNSGRMNIAAANSDNIPRLADCILKVL